MQHRDMPFMLEEVDSHNFDDMYDRIFYKHEMRMINNIPALIVQKMGHRLSLHRERIKQTGLHVASITFGRNNSLGTIWFVSRNENHVVAEYLVKQSMFGGSLKRKFTAHDGNQYRWSHRTVPNQEWTCMSADNKIVANFDDQPPDRDVYGASTKRTLFIHPPYFALTTELVATFLLMRHIKAYSL